LDSRIPQARYKEPKIYFIHLAVRIINIALYYYTMPFTLVLFIIVYTFRFSYSNDANQGHVSPLAEL
jgi:uncharacterized membrane protein